MASDKVNYRGVGAIAQAMKHQIRTGDGWNDLSPAAKEALDQILSSIARTVSSGQGVHWDGIMAYADSAKPSTDDGPADRLFDYPNTQLPARPTDELAESVRRLARDRVNRDA
jgi:hypothetical protein